MFHAKRMYFQQRTSDRSGARPYSCKSARWVTAYTPNTTHAQCYLFKSGHASASQEAITWVCEEGYKRYKKGEIGINDMDITAWDFVELPGKEGEKTSLKPKKERWGHGSVKMATKAAQALVQEAFLPIMTRKDGSDPKPVVIILHEADIRAVFTFCMDRIAWEVSGKTGTVWKLLAAKLKLPLKGFDIERDTDSEEMGPEKRIIVIKCDAAWEEAILLHKKRVYLPVGKLEFRYKREGVFKRKQKEATQPQKRQRVNSTESFESVVEIAPGGAEMDLADSVENVTLTEK